MREFFYSTRIYYNETDALGVVYHGNYLALFERARTEALRVMGLTVTELGEKHDVFFAARNVSLTYKKPLILDDEIIIKTWIASQFASSIIFQQEIRKQTASDVVCTEFSIKLVCVGKDFRPHPFPSWLMSEFEA